MTLSSNLSLEDRIRTKYPYLLPPKGLSPHTYKLKGVAEILTQKRDGSSIETRYIYLTSESSSMSYLDTSLIEGVSKIQAQLNYQVEGYRYIGSRKQPYKWEFPFYFLSEKLLDSLYFHNDEFNESIIPVKWLSTENFLKECEERMKKPLLMALSNATVLVGKVLEYLSLTPPAR